MAHVDISRLPRPRVFADQDFDAILARMTARVVEDVPEFDALTEADPGVALLRAHAYEIDAAYRAVEDGMAESLTAFAPRAVLEVMAGTLGLTVAADESTAALRNRVIDAQLGGYSAATRAGYQSRAEAVPGVWQAGVSSPTPGTDLIYVAGLDEDGVATPPAEPVVAAVRTALAAADQHGSSAVVTVFAVNVDLVNGTWVVEVESGFDPVAVGDAVLEAGTRYIKTHRHVGAGLPASGLQSAAFVEGVRAVIQSPGAKAASPDKIYDVGNLGVRTR